MIGQLTDTGRIVVRHQGRTEAEIPLGPLADEAPLYHRPTAEPTKPAAVNAARIEDRVGLARRAADADRVPGSVLARLGVGPGRLDGRRPDGETPGGGGCRRGAGRGHRPGACADNRLHAALLRRRPGDGRAQAVAEAWRNITAVGAAAAGDHRQHEFRQSGEAGDDGPVRRRDPRAWRRPARRWISRS